MAGDAALRAAAMIERMAYTNTDMLRMMNKSRDTQRHMQSRVRGFRVWFSRIFQGPYFRAQWTATSIEIFAWHADGGRTALMWKDPPPSAHRTAEAVRQMSNKWSSSAARLGRHCGGGASAFADAWVWSD
eukprot:CAMPEP_0174347334 /NCGR_PEP_ID=MMETSP0811_2-20130205/3360_1 /TAXON_ID=73025 ORGANISM="Eutreptiella gymnastica-like, Strain CCMP1594" /NCGR_SAMPLE_ID=MMETSP0811_2 /ASSEMBLY_ACC=CAM_ASM_000667 /LENGTH=129 /DNA_ID=CAMNT_0015472757 /DNA_START=449 /DNA_END=839 /DNA_ORIENTATION=+